METVEASDELTRRARSRLGERLCDKWLLDDLLGVGGMAAVYAATHRNGKRVAIKILHRDIALSEETRARFLREGFVANAVEHPDAVSVLDEDVAEDGSPFFVMDLFDGETLDQRLRRVGPLEVSEVLSAAYQLLDVLAAAHKKGIIHRDVKPENVILTKDLEVKVLDFGIAQLRESAGNTSTKVGHTMGTPSFMSPEQARGRWDEVDAQSDVWSVGATMFTLLTGHHVHEADTMNEVLLGAMASQAPSITVHRPNLPRRVCEIVDTALAFEKSKRWASADAMRAAIAETHRVLGQGSEGWAQRSPEDSAAPAPRRRTGSMLVAAAAVVAAFGAWAVIARSMEQAHLDASAAAQPAKSAAPFEPIGGRAGSTPALSPFESIEPVAPIEPKALAPASAASSATPPPAPPPRPHPVRRTPPGPVTAAPTSSNPLERRH